MSFEMNHYIINVDLKIYKIKLKLSDLAFDVCLYTDTHTIYIYIYTHTVYIQFASSPT